MKLLLKRHKTGDPTKLCFELTEKDAALIKPFLLKNKDLAYWEVDFGKPKTARSRSQNKRINGLIHQLCQYTGDEHDVLKTELKRKAFRRGFPMLEMDGEIVYGIDGLPLPDSERNATTEQAGALIDEIEQFAAENGIILEG